jgi:hypothetical protein
MMTDMHDLFQLSSMCIVRIRVAPSGSVIPAPNGIIILSPTFVLAVFHLCRAPDRYRRTGFDQDWLPNLSPFMVGYPRAVPWEPAHNFPDIYLGSDHLGPPAHDLRALNVGMRGILGILKCPCRWEITGA